MPNGQHQKAANKTSAGWLPHRIHRKKDHKAVSFQSRIPANHHERGFHDLCLKTKRLSDLLCLTVSCCGHLLLASWLPTLFSTW